MAKLSKSQVLHVASLAKLSLTDAEIKKFQKQLSAVVSYFDELREVDTGNIEATSQTTGLTNVFREDEINTTQILPIADALSGAEEVFNNYFKVDLILKHKA